MTNNNNGLGDNRDSYHHIEISFDNDMTDHRFHIEKKKKRKLGSIRMISNYHLRHKSVNHLRSYSNDMLKSMYDQHKKNALIMSRNTSNKRERDKNSNSNKSGVWKRLYTEGIEMKKKHNEKNERIKRENEIKQTKECYFKPIITSIEFYNNNIRKKKDDESQYLEGFIKGFEKKLKEMNVLKNGPNKIQDNMKDEIIKKEYKQIDNYQKQKDSKKQCRSKSILSKAKDKIKRKESNQYEYKNTPFNNNLKQSMTKKEVIVKKNMNYTEKYKTHIVYSTNYQSIKHKKKFIKKLTYNDFIQKEKHN